MPQTTAETAQSILVPVDFSAASVEALLCATQLAACSSGAIVVLHVVHEDAKRPTVYPRRNDKEQMLPLAEIARHMLQDFMTTLREQHPDNECLANAELMVVNGIPATRIAEIAHHTGALKIIMGGSNRGNLSKLITGSVSDGVIRHSTVPVTIIHTNGTILQHSGPELPATGGVETCSPGCLQ